MLRGEQSIMSKAVLGEAILVGGVTSIVRANLLRGDHEAFDGQGTHIEQTLIAMGQFFQAEFQLQQSLGPWNEKSLYTQGNLAELFLSSLHDPILGLLHYRHACVVAVRTLGSQHPNTLKKLQELSEIFQEVGWNDFADYARDGAPAKIDPTAIQDRLLQVGVLRNLVLHRKVGQCLNQMIKSDLVSRAFLTQLWITIGTSLADVMPDDFQ